LNIKIKTNIYLLREKREKREEERERLLVWENAKKREGRGWVGLLQNCLHL